MVTKDEIKPIRCEDKDITQIRKKHPELEVVDLYDSMLCELQLLRMSSNPITIKGVWFYYTWLNKLIHFLPETEHLELRTGRNRYLITKKEQQKFYNSTIGIFGMSVGSHAALTIAMTGGGKYMKIADPDVIDGSNLNRIRSGFQNVGLKKAVVIARQIYEINPYSEIEVYLNGVSDENLERIITGGQKLDILIEEMDNPYFKFRARECVQHEKIPLVAAADNGDGIIAHVERYDNESKTKFFNGILGSMTANDFKELTRSDMVRAVARTVGADKSTLRMQQSVLEVGKSLYSWPQLGTAAHLCGSVLAYLARRVILKDINIKSGIYDVSLDAIFENDYQKNIGFRKQKTEEFLKKMGI